MRRLLSLLILLIVLIFPLFAGRVRSASTACAIHVDVEQKMLTLFCGSEIAARYPIATGARDTPTPLGVFRINRRFSGEMGGFGTCFLGLNVPWGDYGIHGTNHPESIGTNASHGCIRALRRRAENAVRCAEIEAQRAELPLHGANHAGAVAVFQRPQTAAQFAVRAAFNDDDRSVGYARIESFRIGDAHSDATVAGRLGAVPEIRADAV